MISKELHFLLLIVEESSPRACSESSFFLKSCRLRYSAPRSVDSERLRAAQVVGGDVQVDVLGITREQRLLDPKGRELLRSTWEPRPKIPKHVMIR